ncbi:Mob1/phocein [Talaromyces proteolyticus]|uniref:Mob1/phocein n=1 Tax=Talaromyces proteolyticus TaxID=1131652 RepID=A0AAD4KHW9_9EURO|nr:Mob1/phocein [Talaromyces proteolyticus]KAH8691577.1 Mob1/phocein [Talaromyces proteolyticus]
MDFILFDDGSEELHARFDAGLEDTDLIFSSSSSSPSIYPPTPPLFLLPSKKTVSLKVPATTSISRKMAAAAAAVSPSSSPRLPSPPPFPEVQIGPQSPTVGDNVANEKLFAPLSETDDGSTRRIRPGTKAVDMASGLPLIPLSQLDSPFQLQEHLKALYHNYTVPNESDTIQPITREVAVSLAHPPDGVERSLWLYELCRFLTMKVNNLIIAFFAEEPPCSAESCPEMRASEWQYLCAVHDPPKPCCAIDYCCHTLDWATNILTSPKYFPSRLTLGSEAAGGPQASMRHLTNIFRRLYRIFAHAWFQHKDVFRQVENTDGLYVFFKTVCDVYGLIPGDNYTIPAEAEQADGESADDAPSIPSSASSIAPPADGRRVSVLRKDQNGVAHPHFLDDLSIPQTPSNMNTGATTRRHKHSPSTGSSVATIAEAIEENNELATTMSKLGKVAKKLDSKLEEPEENKEKEPVEDTSKEQSIPQENGPSDEKVEPAESESAPTDDEPDKSKAEAEEPEKPSLSSSDETESSEKVTSESGENKAEIETTPAEQQPSDPEPGKEDTPAEPETTEAPSATEDQSTAETTGPSSTDATQISVEEKAAEEE